ncbi:hypothetical protein D3C77_720600 [compost metagenome]
MGAVYRKTDMCDAVVCNSPCATNRNSPANSSPTISPGSAVPSRTARKPSARHTTTANTSAAKVERRPICMIGAMSAATSLMAIC